MAMLRRKELLFMQHDSRDYKVDLVKYEQETAKVSLIVPIHNGQKYIKGLVKRILRQNYPKLELIFVENGSNDDSWNILQEIKKKYPQIKIFQNAQAGTSLARAEGIRQASGDYIIFSDQDDHYRDNDSLSKMMSCVTEDRPDIAQFGHYVQWGPIKKEKRLVADKEIIGRKELLQEKIIPVVASAQGSLTTSVWDKVYKTEVLKNIVEKIQHPLYYDEDMYLNALSFFSSETQKVVVYPFMFYMWQFGVGTSGSAKAGDGFFREYAFLKLFIFNLEQMNGASEKVKFITEADILWSYSSLIKGMIQNDVPKNIVLNSIKEYESMDLVQFAKSYVRQNGGMAVF